MLRYFKLKKYKFLTILKNEFKNPSKKIKSNDIYLDINSEKYEKVMNENYHLYLNILKDLQNYLDIDFYFQKYPNFRFNTKNDKYPVWHNDRHFNHSKDEINVMIPITNKEFGFELIGRLSYVLQYLPLSILNSSLVKKLLSMISIKLHNLNNILVFDSYHLHTASNRKQYKNIRMSIDLRLLPVNHKKKYKNSKRNIPIKPGFYFSEKPISEY